MAYITGSVTDANPGPALYALMAPALTTAGLTLVDTVTISTRTHKVWKSPAASNVQNLDWYLDIGYTTTGAGSISLAAFEMFDPATDLAYRGPYTTSNVTIDAATGSRYGATGNALETNWAPNAATAALQTSLTTTAFGYWISITADRVVLLASTAAAAIRYAGFYEPDPLYSAKAGAALYPLITGNPAGSSSNSDLSLTRIPPWAVLTGGGWNLHLSASILTPSDLVNGQPKLPSDPVTSYPFVAHRQHIRDAGTFDMGRWGFFRDLYVVPATAAVVRGDTCTIGGAAYVLSTMVSGYSYAFKAV